MTGWTIGNLAVDLDAIQVGGAKFSVKLLTDDVGEMLVQVAKQEIATPLIVTGKLKGQDTPFDHYKEFVDATAYGTLVYWLDDQHGLQRDGWFRDVEVQVTGPAELSWRGVYVPFGPTWKDTSDGTERRWL